MYHRLFDYVFGAVIDQPEHPFAELRKQDESSVTILDVIVHTHAAFDGITGLGMSQSSCNPTNS